MPMQISNPLFDAVPYLRTQNIQGLVQLFVTPPELKLRQMFMKPTPNLSESERIEWESFEGVRGMSPFVARDASSPSLSIPGSRMHMAFPAFIKEKTSFSESFVNRYRQMGTINVVEPIAQQVSRAIQTLTYRVMRREEWMIARMLSAGGFTYIGQQPGSIMNVDYGIPSENQVTLAASKKWGTGTSVDILADIVMMKQIIKRAVDVEPSIMMVTSDGLKLIGRDPLILTLLQRSAYGDGNLLGAGASAILGINVSILQNLLALPTIMVYDEMYTVERLVTANVAASGTTIYVDDSSDLEVADGTSYNNTMRLYNDLTGEYEEITCSVINTTTNALTVGAITGAVRGGSAHIVQIKTYLPNDTAVFLAPSVMAQPVAEWHSAPYGFNRVSGIQVDTVDFKDPDRRDAIIQSYGLPILKIRGAVGTLKFA